jgi:hypothetical protein
MAAARITRKGLLQGGGLAMIRALIASGPVAGLSAGSGRAEPDVASLDTIDALRVWTGPAADSVLVLGFATPGDGGGGRLVRIGADTTSPDNGVTVFVDAAGRRWRRLDEGPIDVRWAGARCDGVTDDAKAVAAAASVGPIAFVAGTCLVGASITVGSAAAAWPGRIKVATGQTLTFAGGFAAPRWPVFLNATSGGGAIAFVLAAGPPDSGQAAQVGYPEWWGAVTFSRGVDNRAALDACVRACAVTRLAAGDYWIGDTWRVAASHRLIEGVGRDGDGQAPATRVLLDSPTRDVLMVGTDSRPAGGINAFVQYVDLRNITVVSAAAPAPPRSGVQGGPSCVRGQYILNCSFSEVYTKDGTNGFYFTGAVYSQLNDCASQRLSRGTERDNDYFIGCMLDGSTPIAANTGIASFYIRKYSVTGTTNDLVNHGVYAADGCTDMFIEAVETSGVQIGISLNGNPGAAYGSEDCKVFDCVLDQVERGVIVSRGGGTTAIVIQNCYIATAAASPGSIGILVESTPSHGVGQGGSVSLIGNQLISSGPGATGLAIRDSSGVESQGNILTDFESPILLSSSVGCRFADRISNPTRSARLGAVVLADSARSVIDCMVDGKPGAFPSGVDLQGRGNSVVEARMTGVDAGAMAGGAANKLVSDGVPVTAAGPFGNGSLAQGIMD